jgi:hypothetical protein
MIDVPICFVLAATFGSFGCRLKHNPIEHPPKGAFLYRGFDSAGTLDSVSFKGTWRYSTIRGIVSEGAFEAIKPE